MGSVNPKLVVALIAAVVIALGIRIVNPHRKYSTQEFWVDSTIATVRDVPADALEPGNKNGGVLMWAAMGTSDTAVITELVNRGADINEHDPLFAGTPLSGAAGYGREPKILEELVRLGAQVEATLSNGETALMIAAQFNADPRITQTLLSLGADPERQNLQGRNALQLAELKGNHAAASVLRAAMAPERIAPGVE